MAYPARRERGPRPSRSETFLSVASAAPGTHKTVCKPAGNTTNPERPACRFWLKGYCKYASDCAFRHDSPFSIYPQTFDARVNQICEYAVANRCPNRDNCQYKHRVAVEELVVPDLAHFPHGPPMSEAEPMHRPPQTVSGAAYSPLNTNDTLEFVIRNSIIVHYGPGLEVVRVMLPCDTTITSANLRTTAKLVWDGPTHTAVLGYHSSELAHRMASGLTGRRFDGRHLTAYYQDEGQPSVEIPGLSLSTDLDGLKAIGKADVVRSSAPSYHPKAAMKALRGLLSQHGPLHFFHPLPPPRANDDKMRAVACFLRPDHLEAAISALHRTRQACVAGSPIWFHRKYSIEYSIPAAHFAAIKQLIKQLSMGRSMPASIRVIEPRASTVKITMEAEQPAFLAQLKADVDNIIHGEVLCDHDGLILWDQGFFAGAAARLFLQRLNDEGMVFVICDAKRRHVRICGHPGDTAEARGWLLSLYRAHLDDRRTVAIDENRWNGEECPVCRGEAEEPMRFPCGHYYCASCLRHYLASASSSERRVFPLLCIAPSPLPLPPGLPIKRPPMCDAPIPVSVIRRLLRPDDEAALLDASFVAYVYSHPGTYKFCSTPDCNQVYYASPPDKPSLFTCPGCLESTCTACHSAHPGLTCSGYRALLVARHHCPDAIKRCPCCGTLLQKLGGCNHVQCLMCKAHLCWVCLQSFPNGRVYEHIASMHSAS
ncbi:hypothetical protein AURDEDRAFT_124693 [Auricularia subglabra TFB-10046 SS5]|nr:hypothetical protein AURDEDRAFT_124693 [Auricularia subglabra TFB-10046 SS5]